MARGGGGMSNSSSSGSPLKRISQEEVYNLIKAALAEFPRYDEPHSYGIAEDVGTNDLVIYFDLPRVLPLQFNISVPYNSSPEVITSHIKQTIEGRLKINGEVT
jgi:hypothetical protein